MIRVNFENCKRNRHLQDGSAAAIFFYLFVQTVSKYIMPGKFLVHRIVALTFKVRTHCGNNVIHSVAIAITIGHRTHFNDDIKIIKITPLSSYSLML